jgi:putative polyhydroxyalkanoate system protein
MADIDINHAHPLGKDIARTKAEQILTKLGSEYGIKGTWAGDVFNINKPVDGKFTVTDTHVRVELTLGFAMRMMKGKIEERVRAVLSDSLK